MPPTPHAVSDVCRELASIAERTRRDGPWQSGAFERLARGGLLAAFIPADCDGTAASETDILPMLVEIGRTCLTTALALTQWAAGCRLIAAGSADVRRRYLPPLARGETLTTVGISQLTTSRRHLSAPVLQASQSADGWRLTGTCPWVTGGDSADTIVTAATVIMGGGGPPPSRFFIVPRLTEGVRVDPPMELLGLAGSRTSSVQFDGAVAAEAIELEGGRGVRSASAGERAETHPLQSFMDRHGTAILVGELVILAIATVGSVAVDHAEGERIRRERQAVRGRDGE